MSDAVEVPPVQKAPEAKSKASKKSKPAASPSKKTKSGAKNQPGRYSQLVVDTIKKLGERSGSSLAKIYSEAKKVSWFDQQNGRTYLKYSVKALVQNDTLVQVKGVGANGSFKLNKKKLEGQGAKKSSSSKVSKPAAKKDKKVKVKSAAKKEKKPKSVKKEKAKKPTKAAAGAKKVKKVKKSAKPSVPKVPKAKKA